MDPPRPQITSGFRGKDEQGSYLSELWYVCIYGMENGLWEPRIVKFKSGYMDIYIYLFISSHSRGNLTEVHPVTDDAANIALRVRISGQQYSRFSSMQKE